MTILPDVHYGNTKPLVWRDEEDTPDPDDALEAVTDPSIVRLLGFDPLTLGE